MSFPQLAQVAGDKPFEPFGKDSSMLRRRKHGTTGRLALPHQNTRGEIAETVRSAPGQGPTDGGVISILGALARKSLRPLRNGDRASSLDRGGLGGVFRARLAGAIGGLMRHPGSIFSQDVEK
jgi:hypothetical protein